MAAGQAVALIELGVVCRGSVADKVGHDAAGIIVQGTADDLDDAPVA